MRAERLARAHQRVFEEWERTLRRARVKVVEAGVEQRADLDVAVLDAVPQVGALAIQLARSREVAEFLVQPADRVRDPADDEVVVALAREVARAMEEGVRL